MTASPIQPFTYALRVQPHHTDYAGIVWHGTYIAWMEEARVEYLRVQGLGFDQWIAAGIDLPVVELSLRYRQSLSLGMEALVNLWPAPRRGVRIHWQYDIQNQATGETCVEGQVVLAPVDRSSRKVLRRLSPPFQHALDRLYAGL